MAGAENVRPAVRDRVLAAAQELGYERNLLAQSLRRGASMSVGFVVRDISNPVMAEIVLGAERVLRTAGYALSLTNSEGQPGLDAEYVRYFRQRAVDGLLLSLSDEQFGPTIDELKALAVPFVAVDRELAPELGGGAVYLDHARGLESVVRYLFSLGHRRIGLLAGPRELRPGREVARALEEFCALHPGATGTVEHGPFSFEFGERAASRMLTAAERPTAIIAGGYYILLGLLAAIRAFGQRIPGDVSVVTFDDLDSLAFFDPPISVVSREPLELGRRAGELLLASFAGETPDPVVISPIFRPRDSCGPVSTG
jgi:LacI family transcriptional regulator